MNDKEKELNERIRLMIPPDPLEEECQQCGRLILPKGLQPFKNLDRVCDECVEFLKSNEIDKLNGENAPCQQCGTWHPLKILQLFKSLKYVCNKCYQTLSELWNSKIDVNNFEVTFTYTLNSQDWYIRSSYNDNEETSLSNEDVKEMLLEDLKSHLRELDVYDILGYCTFKKLI